MSNEENSFLSFINAKSRKEKIPVTGTFELSPICNLDCKMCYVRKTAGEVAAHERPMVTLEQWKRIADEACDSGLLFLLLTGGEPFLWPDFRELYEYLCHKGVVVSVNSNGTLITDDTLRWLTDCPPSKINITLYGASDETYEKLCGAKQMYHRVTENIERLTAAGIEVKINLSLTQYNVQDMETMIDFAKEHHLPYEVSTYMFPPIRRDGESVGAGDRFRPAEAAYYYLKEKELSHPEQYLEYLRYTACGLIPSPGLAPNCSQCADTHMRCAAGKASFWITWDGYMTPCGMMPNPKADVLQQGFRGAWQQIMQNTEQIRLSDVCDRCSNKMVCHCCAAMAIAETGRSEGIPGYLCQMADEIRKLAQKEVEIPENSTY